MFKQDRVLGVIAARGGSKGLPGKNIADLGGKPVIAWSIEAAKKSRYLDRAIVSTDDEAIASVARQFDGDVPFLRPAELSTDEAPIADAMIHALETLNEDYDLVVLLPASCPFRTQGDVDEPIQIAVETEAQSCVSVTRIDEPPAYNMEITENTWLKPVDYDALFKRRQELPDIYRPNCSVYAVETKFLLANKRVYGDRTAAYVMPNTRSVDLDTLYDLQVARGLLSVGALEGELEQ